MRSRIIPQLISIIIIGLFVLGGITVTTTITLGSATNNSEPTTDNTRQSGIEDIRLYFHRDNTMDTSANESGLPFYSGIYDGEDFDFALNPVLQADLEVTAIDVGGGDYGFEILLRISNPPVNSRADITIKILDGTSVIAATKSPIGINPGDSAPRHKIPFVEAGKTKHTFKKGNAIHVNINASLTGSLPVTIRYDESEHDGYLELNCISIIDISVAAHHGDDTLTEFYPNHPVTDERLIRFKGSVSDKFGSYDITNVQITLQGVFNNLPANYTSTPDDATGYFTMDYTYSTGLPSGEYPITAYISFNSDRKHDSGYSSLTMAYYGVYLECQNHTGEGYQGETVSFSIKAYNVGGNKDSISLTPTIPADRTGWFASFVGGDTTTLIDPATFPNNYNSKTLEVTVSTAALKNEECLVSVTGDSVNDGVNKVWQLSPSISVVAKLKHSFNFDLLSAAQQSISEGESAVYDFKLQNNGGDWDTYTVEVVEPLIESNWEVILTSNHPSTIIVSDLELTLVLDKTKEASCTLTVTAPAEPTVKELPVNVQATSENTTDTVTKSTTTDIIGAPPPPGEVVLDSISTTETASPGDEIDDDALMDVSFSISAENTDSVNAFSINLQVDKLDNWGWDYTISPDSFDLSAGQTESDISIIISISETEDAGSYTFTLTANYGSGQKDDLDLSVIIPEVYDILLETTETEKSVAVGKTITYEISVTNKGNVPDTEIEITVTELSGWEIELSRTTITLKGYDTVTNIDITMKPTDEVEENDPGILDIQAKLKKNNENVGNKLTLRTTPTKDTAEKVANFFQDYWLIPVFVVFIFIATLLIRRRLK